jgi:thiol-disulfide isomerase/thioredoxin
MFKTSAIIVALLANCLFVYGQAVKKDSNTVQHIRVAPMALQKASSVTFHLNTVEGIGPAGFSSSEIGTVASYKTSDVPRFKEETKAYPEMKNKPDLTKVVEYFYMTDPAQFYYQNYVSGLFNKEFLIKKFEDFHVDMADTLTLSRKQLKCYISVMAGFNAANEPMYIVDANNNGSFADDTLKPVLKQVYEESMILSAAVPVTLSYLYKGQIKEESRLVFLQQGHDPQNFTLSFSFPQFKYMPFKYKGQAYIMITDGSQLRPFFTIVPDRPYFTGLGQAKSINKGQIAQIGSDNFKLSDINNNGNDVVLTGDDISGFGTYKVTANKLTGKSAKTIVSRQLGFKAPEIKGINMNPKAQTGTAVNTTALKGKYVLIDFWSTYCPPCIDEFDFLKEVYKKYSPKNLEILGVIDDRDENTTLKILREHDITWPNITATAKATQIKGYGDIMAYPTTFLLDPDGKIIAIDLRGEALMNKLKTLIAVK